MGLERKRDLANLLHDFLPYAYGISKLKISEADLENFCFNVVEIDCRMPDGTQLVFPGNCQIERREFKEVLDQLGGEMGVFLALPVVTEIEPNCLPVNAENITSGVKYRHAVRGEKVADYNTGGNRQEIQLQFYNSKLLFQGESTYGYECLKIGVIQRSAKYGSIPKMSERYAPPTLNLGASPLLDHMKRETGNRLLAKNRQLRAYWRSQNTSSAMKARDAMKVQTVAVATNAFRQLENLKPLHPAVVYQKMTELIGMLSIYCDDDRLVQPPAYNHDDLASCFRKAETSIVALLALLEESSFESRVFQDTGGLLLCTLNPTWLGPKHELYIGFQTSLENESLAKSVRPLKIAPENQIENLNRRRLHGMTLEGPIDFVQGLPQANNVRYFHLSSQNPLYSRLVSQAEPILAISGDSRFSELTTLFVVNPTNA